MLTTLGIIVPVFSLIFAGFFVGKTRLFSEEGVRGLTNFVLYLASPALLFPRVPIICVRPVPTLY